MDTDGKLERMAARAREGRHLKVMIVGLGSVGNYLLSYLLDDADGGLDVVVAGRDAGKMRSDVNIATVAALIRGKCQTRVEVAGGVDLEDVDGVAKRIAALDPDIVVNSSRAYTGIKYGSISWDSVRAYGIWAPLAVRYTRNVAAACDQAGNAAVLVNTSYSDATIPWLATAGAPCPDFGSGNLNHIAPRIKMAAAEMAGIGDFWNVGVELATSHFHDVVISKEGHDEGLTQLLKVSYGGRPLNLDYAELLSRCAIPMPTDQRRNMMNASSDYGIIRTLVDATRGRSGRFFSPGAFGEVGGYPVVVDGTGGAPVARIDESAFPLSRMRERNRASLALDGIEDVRGGVLVYTDELVGRVEGAFGARLPKEVPLSDADEVAGFLVREVIEPELERRGR